MAKAESYGAVLLLRFHEHAEEPEEQLQIVFRLARENGVMVKFRGSWPTLRYEPSNIMVSHRKRTPISKKRVSGLHFCGFCTRKLQKYDLRLPVFPRIRTSATSSLCRSTQYDVLCRFSTTAHYSENLQGTSNSKPLAQGKVVGAILLGLR